MLFFITTTAVQLQPLKKGGGGPNTSSEEQVVPSVIVRTTTEKFCELKFICFFVDSQMVPVQLKKLLKFCLGKPIRLAFTAVACVLCEELTQKHVLQFGLLCSIERMNTEQPLKHVTAMEVYVTNISSARIFEF